MPRNDPGYQREYMRKKRLATKVEPDVESAPDAAKKVEELEEEVKHLKREISSARIDEDGVIIRAKAVSKAKRAVAEMRRDLAGTNDYRALIQNMSQERRDEILKRIQTTSKREK